MAWYDIGMVGVWVFIACLALFLSKDIPPGWRVLIFLVYAIITTLAAGVI